MFSSTSSQETLRFSGNIIYCSPNDQSLTYFLCVLWENTAVNQSLGDDNDSVD